MSETLEIHKRVHARTRVRAFALLTQVLFWSFTWAGEAQVPKVRLLTTLGTIEVELYPDHAPATVENFLQLVDDGFYDGVIFHRVIANFMIQAGSFDAHMRPREAPRTVPNESFNGLLNRKGYLAMARADDPDSAAADFYINVAANEHLDAGPGKPGYTVFGRVIAGWEAVEEIELSDTGIRAGMPAVPDEPIVILEASRI